MPRERKPEYKPLSLMCDRNQATKTSKNPVNKRILKVEKFSKK